MFSKWEKWVGPNYPNLKTSIFWLENPRTWHVTFNSLISLNLQDSAKYDHNIRVRSSFGGFNKIYIFFRKLEKTEFSIEMWQPERLEFLHILPKLLVWGWLERSQRICIWPIWAPWYLVDLRSVSWNLLGVCHMWYMLFAWWSTSTAFTCVYTCCLAYSPGMVRTYAVPTWTDKHVLDRQPTLGFFHMVTSSLGCWWVEAHISSTASRNGCPLNLLITGWYVRTY